jgi:hypothetical protein
MWGQRSGIPTGFYSRKRSVTQKPKRYAFFAANLISKDQYSCKWCNRVLADATHFKEHLRVCKIYIQWTITKSVQANNPFDVSLSTIVNQNMLNFPELSKDQKAELNLQAAMWCFMSNHSFRMFENPFGKRFLQALNLAYQPPPVKPINVLFPI